MNSSRQLARFATIGMATLALGCTRQPPAQPDTRAADEAAVRAADEAWSRSATNGQLDPFLATYAADAAVLAPNNPMTSDEAGRRKLFGGLFASPGFVLGFQPGKVEVARAGDIAYTLGTYQLTLNDANGKPIVDHGKYVTIWRKQPDGGWKSIVDMFNTDLAASPIAPAEAPAPPRQAR
jgi:ketosteroid isomerase-like protein